MTLEQRDDGIDIFGQRGGRHDLSRQVDPNYTVTLPAATARPPDATFGFLPYAPLLELRLRGRCRPNQTRTVTSAMDMTSGETRSAANQLHVSSGSRNLKQR